MDGHAGCLLHHLTGLLVHKAACPVLHRCCIDTKPRKFDAESANLLCNFAEMVVREIEKEKARVCTCLCSSGMRSSQAFDHVFPLDATSAAGSRLFIVRGDSGLQ